MPSRRQAALCAQCCELVGSQPCFVETHAPASRQRSLSAQESAATWTLGVASTAGAPDGSCRSCRREQDAVPTASKAR